jgi:hypothetical protein
MGFVGYFVGIEVHHQLHRFVDCILRSLKWNCLTGLAQNITRQDLSSVTSSSAHTHNTNPEEFHTLQVGK